MNNPKVQVWECKIVIPEGELPNAFDGPPRSAAIAAIEAAGLTVLGCSSGWGGRLTEDEQISFKDIIGDVYIAGLMDADESTEH